MIGWLIYDREQYRRNEWFAQKLLACCSAFCTIELVLAEELALEIADNAPVLFRRKQAVAPPDFAIVRTIDPLLSLTLEGLGVRLFNSYLTSKICNDKRLSYLAAAKAGLNVLRTSVFPAEAAEEDGLPPGLSYPVVLKSAAGHGGREVFLAENPAELLAARRALGAKAAVLQEKCKSSGKDLRIYLLGGEIVGAVLRTSKEFRSNYSLGADISLYPVGRAEREAVEKLLAALPFSPDFIGVDFLLDNGALVFNEMEDVVGTRMLYAAADLDAARLYAGYIGGVMKDR